MANYATLKAAIQAVIKTNGNEEITGALLQQSLLAMIESLGVGYQFMGIAAPNTNPGTPDQKIFYIAGIGTYVNFGNTTITDGNIGLFVYDSSWHYNSVSFADLTQFAKKDDILIFPLDISSLPTSNGIITATNVWTTSSGTCSFLPIEPGKSYKIVNDSGQTANIAVLKVSGVGAVSSTPQWATGYTGRIVMANGTSQIIDVPSDGAYLYIRRTDTSSNNITPSVFSTIDLNAFVFKTDLLVSVISLGGLNVVRGIIASNNTCTI